MNDNLNLYLVTGRVTRFEYMQPDTHTNEMRIVWASDPDEAEDIFFSEFNKEESIATLIEVHEALSKK